MNLNDLNTEQREAVSSVDGPLLVLAGAGSGKTRVLTYRVANLIYNHGIPPWSILALTFTNKAAREMRERIEKLIGESSQDMWVSTFHSCCVRILRRDIELIGYDKRFVVYDDSDQLSVFADIIKSLNLNEEVFQKRSVRAHISHAKNHSLNVEEYLGAGACPDEYIRIYRAYQRKMKQNNALDFDDLLLKTIELFTSCPDALQRYRDKFRYLLIDEYQDTNMAQYTLVRLLGAEHRNVCVVGDDDQSIYGWRGADVRNILEFEKDFPGARVIRLEQNYRSTSIILDAANAVIRKNISRKPKKLWTKREGGEGIRLYEADDDRIEADYIARRISQSIREGKGYDDHAVLYRTNAQSRLIETTFISYGIPYRVYGGLRFYERAEVKDVLAYLRLIYNPADDVSFQRIINVPRRGIGAVALNELMSASADSSLFITAMTDDGLSPRVKSKLLRFTEEMTELITIRETMPLDEFTEELLERIDYYSYLRDDKKENYETRMDNVKELMGAIREFEAGLQDDVDVLGAFLENVALISDIDGLNETSGQVALMTMHSAKGLEFPVVFICGMEETIFPSHRAMQEARGLEEERRLCYVGITRAMDELHMVYARRRNLYGSFRANTPSRFLSDIPPTLFDDNARKKPKIAAPQPIRPASHGGFGASIPSSPEPSAADFKTNQIVRHLKFGRGRVLNVEGKGSAQIVTIDFGSMVKKFAAAFAPIEIDD